MNPYDLVQTQYLQVGATNNHSFCVLPPETKKKAQRILVGDDSTTLQCFEYLFKKQEFNQVFKTQPTGKDVTRVMFSGQPPKYNIFYSSGQSIRGVNKKGKEFFKLDTNQTEVVRALHVEQQFLWTASEYFITCYQSD